MPMYVQLQTRLLYITRTYIYIYLLSLRLEFGFPVVPKFVEGDAPDVDDEDDWVESAPAMVAKACTISEVAAEFPVAIFKEHVHYAQTRDYARANRRTI